MSQWLWVVTFVGLSWAQEPTPDAAGPGTGAPADPGPDAGVPPAVGDDEDRIAIVLTLDDRALGRVSRPRVTAESAGVGSIDLLDDGALLDEAPGDAIWTAGFTVPRSEHLAISVLDDRTPLGSVTVFLPSASEARVDLQTTPDGLRLRAEPETLSGTVAASQTGGGNGGGGGSIDHLAHVLWVGIALFVIGFGYTRRVLDERWSEEVAPVLKRLDAFLSDPTSRG